MCSAFNAGGGPGRREPDRGRVRAPTTASAGLNRLRNELDAPRALRDVGLAEDDIPEAAALALAAIPASNPRPVTAENLEALLRARLGRGTARHRHADLSPSVVSKDHSEEKGHRMTAATGSTSAGSHAQHRSARNKPPSRSGWSES